MLRGDDAVAALIIDETGRYLAQLRDPLPQIFYPDHWGCFGGAVNPGEAPEAALRRELQEELELDVGDVATLPSAAVSYFTRFDFDFAPLGQRRLYRIYYEVRIASTQVLKLHEGAELRWFTGADILRQARVTPYDAFALWMHYQRARAGR